MGACRRSGHKSLAEHLLTLSRDPAVSARAIALNEGGAHAHVQLLSEAVGVPPLTEIIKAHLRASQAQDKLGDSVVVNLHASPEAMPGIISYVMHIITLMNLCTIVCFARVYLTGNPVGQSFPKA